MFQTVSNFNKSGGFGWANMARGHGNGEGKKLLDSSFGWLQRLLLSPWASLPLKNTSKVFPSSIFCCHRDASSLRFAHTSPIPHSSIYQHFGVCREEGRLSSPSMSIGLDRSRDSLDHSICSNPTRDETLVGTTAVPVATATGLLTAQTIAQQEAATGIHKGQLQPVDGTGGGAETVHSGRKQSEK